MEPGVLEGAVLHRQEIEIYVRGSITSFSSLKYLTSLHGVASQKTISLIFTTEPISEVVCNFFFFPLVTGVKCYDTVEGFQCGPCPSGHVGDGQRCKVRSGCDNNPCAPGK